MLQYTLARLGMIHITPSNCKNLQHQQSGSGNPNVRGKLMDSNQFVMYWNSENMGKSEWSMCARLHMEEFLR